MGRHAHARCLRSAARGAPASLVLVAALGCSADAEPDSDETAFTYCDASIVFEEKCVRCHTQDGDVGTPFQLETFEQVSERTTAVRRVVGNETMPPVELYDLDPPIEALTDAEKEVIVSWIDAGAPAGDCD